MVPHRQEMPSGELSSAPAMEIQSQIISEEKQKWNNQKQHIQLVSDINAV